MGCLKQLLPWPPQTEHSKPLIAAAYDSIARVCDAMFVVLGYRAEEVISALQARSFRHYLFVDPTAEMLQSVQKGLAAAPIAWGISENESIQFLLHPADHPEVRLETLDALVTTAAALPDRAVMPQYRGCGGHPVLIPQTVANSVCGYAGDGGLRQFWKEHPEMCFRLAVDDPGVVFDLDTRVDYDSRF